MESDGTELEQVVHTYLAKRVWCTKFQSSLLNNYFRLSGFQSSLLPIHFRYVFEQRTSTGSEAFSLFICLDANKFALLSFFPLIKTIYPRVSTKPLTNDAKSPLPLKNAVA